MLRMLVAIFLILWMLGYFLQIGGAGVHFLMIIALIIVIVNSVTGKKSKA